MEEHTQNIMTDVALVIGVLDQNKGITRNTLDLLTTVSDAYYYVALDSIGMRKAVAAYEKGQKAAQDGLNLYEVIAQEKQENWTYDQPHRDENDYWNLIQEFARQTQQ